MALEGSGSRRGACPDPGRAPQSQLGPETGRRVALLIDGEQLAEPPARRAAPGPAPPGGRRQLDPRGRLRGIR